jgi:hypothetical protein
MDKYCQSFAALSQASFEMHWAPINSRASHDCWGAFASRPLNLRRRNRSICHHYRSMQDKDLWFVAKELALKTRTPAAASFVQAHWFITML